MKLMICALFAMVATASAAREKRGYFDFPEYGPHPIYHAPVIAKPMATSYSHFKSEVVSHPVITPAYGYGHSYGYGHPYGFGNSYGYGGPYGYGHSYGYGRPYGYGHSYGYGRPSGYGHSYGYGRPYGYGHSYGYGGYH